MYPPRRKRHTSGMGQRVRDGGSSAADAVGSARLWPASPAAQRYDSVLAYRVPAPVIRRLRADLNGCATVCDLDGPSEVLEAAHELLVPSVVLLPPVGAEGHSLAPVIQRLHARRPSIFALVIDDRPGHGRSVVLALRAGATDCVSYLRPGFCGVVRQLLQRARLGGGG